MDKIVQTSKRVLHFFQKGKKEKVKNCVCLISEKKNVFFYGKYNFFE